MMRKWIEKHWNIIIAIIILIIGLIIFYYVLLGISPNAPMTGGW